MKKIKKDEKRQLWKHLLQEEGKMLSKLKYQVHASNGATEILKISFNGNYEMRSIDR